MTADWRVVEGVMEVRKRVEPGWVRSRISRRSLGVMVEGVGAGEGVGTGEAVEEEGVFVAVAEEDEEVWFGGIFEVCEDSGGLRGEV